MNRLKDIESLAHGNAGALASLCSTILLYPLENIKTRMHISEGQESKRNVQQVIKEVLKNEGLLGFYKGMTPLAIGNYISYGVYFFWYEYFKHVFHTDMSSSFQIIKPSLCSAILTSVVTNPFWVMQSKMTVGDDKLNFFSKTQKVISEQGFSSLYKGLVASMILTVNPIIQFMVYEEIKKKYQYSANQAIVTFLGGAVSKAIATIITYPYQILRTKCHISGRQQNSYIQILKKLIADEGLLGIFKGLSPKLVQSVLNSALLLMFYEKIYEIIKQAIILLIIEFLKYKKKVKKLQKVKVKN